MQFTTAIVAALTVLGASTIPWKSEPTGCPAVIPPNTGGSPPTSTEYCCDSTALLGLTCVLSSAIGNSCTQQTICCVNNGGTQDCSQTDGTSISIPINLAISL